MRNGKKRIKLMSDTYAIVQLIVIWSGVALLFILPIYLSVRDKK
jgi:hypothetical protein